MRKAKGSENDSHWVLEKEGTLTGSGMTSSRGPPRLRRRMDGNLLD